MLRSAKKTVFVGFLQDTRLKVATVPFLKEPEIAADANPDPPLFGKEGVGQHF